LSGLCFERPHAGSSNFEVFSALPFSPFFVCPVASGKYRPWDLRDHLAVAGAPSVFCTWRCRLANRREQTARSATASWALCSRPLVYYRLTRGDWCFAARTCVGRNDEEPAEPSPAPSKANLFASPPDNPSIISSIETLATIRRRNLANRLSSLNFCHSLQQ